VSSRPRAWQRALNALGIVEIDVMKSLSVGIVGATGLVGQELFHVLKKRGFPVGKLRLFASANSAGKVLHDTELEQLRSGCFSGLDVVFFAAGSDVSKRWAPEAVSQGAFVVDNSSAFRMEEGVPLVVPEINAHTMSANTKLIANPNCSTILALVALAPLHEAFGLRQLIASTYQAVSGSGKGGVDALSAEMRAWCDGCTLSTEHYPKPIVLNVIPLVDTLLEDGSSREEWKLRVESQKILQLPDLKVAATCVRVPVMRAHSMALTVSFDKSFSLEEAKDCLQVAAGVCLYEQEAIPTPQDASGVGDCIAGRLRLTDVLPNGLALWVSGDQLLKGAALNAVQIAEKVFL